MICVQSEEKLGYGAREHSPFGNTKYVSNSTCVAGRIGQEGVAVKMIFCYWRELSAREPAEASVLPDSGLMAPISRFARNADYAECMQYRGLCAEHLCD